MRINLKTLTIFDAAARHSNFRIAAEELSRTQSAVAQAIRRLENDLEVKLFHRHAKGISLTERGEEYHSSIRSALEIIEQATQRIIPSEKAIVISVTPSFAAQWLVPQLHDFSNKHPDINLKIDATPNIADFNTDGVDMSIRIGIPPFEKGVTFGMLSPLNLCAVASPEHAREIVKKINTIEDFASQRLIQDAHQYWDKLLIDSSGKKISTPILTFNQTSLAIEASKDGQGISLVPYLLVEKEIIKNRLVVLWDYSNDSERGFYLVYPEGKESDPIAKPAIDWIISKFPSYS